MANIRDITGKNRKFTGTASVKIPEGTTGQRVDLQGGLRFNTTTGLAEYYTGSSWKVIDSPPEVSSVSPAAPNGSGVTVTVTGDGFNTTGTTLVNFVDGVGTSLSGTSVNVVSATSLTVVTPTLVGTNAPYDIKVTNPSGLSATGAGLISVGASPVFTTAAGAIGDVDEGATDFSGLSTLVATDADGDTITYSISAGALPSGVSMSTSTAALSGTAPTVSADTTYTFTVQAIDTKLNAVTRQFTMDVDDVPIFEYLIVGGGGGGGDSWDGDGNHGSGGGGGAGGYLADTAFGYTPSAVYNVVVGAGGNNGGGGSTSGTGFTGGDSSLIGTGLSKTAGGGGGGGVEDVTGSAGASGGGGGGKNSHQGGHAGSEDEDPDQGYDGGSGHTSVTASSCAGGGGGAGGIGQNGYGNSTGSSSSHGGAGGIGINNDITGTSVGYAGGGGGGATWGGPIGGFAGGGNSAGQNSFGGGDGGQNNATKTGFPAVDGTGGGGGGCGGGVSVQGGDGGNGVVIIRIATSLYSGTTSGTPTVTTDGNFTVIKFTGNGSYTA
jgi:hypothetical protein